MPKKLNYAQLRDRQRQNNHEMRWGRQKQQQKKIIFFEAENHKLENNTIKIFWDFSIVYA